MAKIRVQAVGEVGKVVGYYEHVRRRGGDVFNVEESHFSPRWMLKLDEDATPSADSPSPPPAAPRRPSGKKADRAADDDVI